LPALLALHTLNIYSLVNFCLPYYYHHTHLASAKNISQLACYILNVIPHTKNITHPPKKKEKQIFFKKNISQLAYYILNAITHTKALANLHATHTLENLSQLAYYTH
jgi:hypothetical protein